MRRLCVIFWLVTGCAGNTGRHVEDPAVAIARTRQSLLGAFTGPLRVTVSADPGSAPPPVLERVARVLVEPDATGHVRVSLLQGFEQPCRFLADVDATHGILPGQIDCPIGPEGGVVHYAGIQGRLERVGEALQIEIHAHRVEERGGVSATHEVTMNYTGHPPLESSIGRFRIEFPGVPVSRQITRAGLESTFFLLDLPSRGRTYELNYTDLAEPPTRADDANAVLIRAQDAYVNAQGASLVSSVPGASAGTLTLDARMTIHDGRGEIRGRWVLAGQRLYQLVVTGNYGEVFDSEEVEAFFASFRVLSVEELRDLVP